MAIHLDTKPVATPPLFNLNNVSNKGFIPQFQPPDQLKFRRKESTTKRALKQLVDSYGELRASIKLNEIDPDKVEEYIRAAEREQGRDYSKEEVDLLKQLAKLAKQDPEAKRDLGLALHRGIPKKAEESAMAAFGRLLVYRDDVDALRQFVQQPGQDPNLVAHVETVLAMLQAENWLAIKRRFSFTRLTGKVKKQLKELATLQAILPVFGESQQNKGGPAK